jgi:hypothetical protein
VNQVNQVNQPFIESLHNLSDFHLKDFSTISPVSLGSLDTAVFFSKRKNAHSLKSVCTALRAQSVSSWEATQYFTRELYLKTVKRPSARVGLASCLNIGGDESIHPGRRLIKCGHHGFGHDYTRRHVRVHFLFPVTRSIRVLE